jgi:hypothetical protein
MVVRKETKGLGVVLIRPVDKVMVRDMMMKHHYSHKWNTGFGVHCYGIFREERPDECLGAAAFGYMKNFHAHMFSHPNPDAWMCELNRLWIDDCLGHNAETVLLGASLRMLRQDDRNIVAVQSFADGRLGCGTVYKAANFRYYGYHYSLFLENVRTGEVVHQQILTNSTSASGFLRANIAYLIGDFKVFKVKTYRYIYPLCRHFRFRLAERPYPEYERGMEPVVWTRDREAIKRKIVGLLDKV